MKGATYLIEFIEEVPGHSLNNEDRARLFWSKVSIQADSECWIWEGAVRSNGYGHMMWLGRKWRGSHRIAWALDNNVDPLSLTPKDIIMHKCDNPLCCNPSHLIKGTQLDNVKDAMSKGRLPLAEKSTSSKLTSSKAREIVNRYKMGNVSQRVLAEEYGVSQVTIGRITRGETNYWLNDEEEHDDG